MEDTHGGSFIFTKIILVKVLILIIMEDTHGAIRGDVNTLAKGMS